MKHVTSCQEFNPHSEWIIKANSLCPKQIATLPTTKTVIIIQNKTEPAFYRQAKPATEGKQRPVVAGHY